MVKNMYSSSTTAYKIHDECEEISIACESIANNSLLYNYVISHALKIV